MNRKFGWKPHKDKRSRKFPIRELLGAPRKLRSYTWACDTFLDQGREGACVGFAWAHELAAKPFIIKNVTNKTGHDIYKAAQKLDQWPGENYEGTSVLAGAKAVKNLHAIEEYRWAFGLDDVLQTLAYYGPVVLGVNWFEGMYSPDTHGFIHVTGRKVGGHAILARGINVKEKYIRLHNSWGKKWGMDGDCFLSFDDLGVLLKQRGEACIITKRKKVIL